MGIAALIESFIILMDMTSFSDIMNAMIGQADVPHALVRSTSDFALLCVMMFNSFFLILIRTWGGLWWLLEISCISHGLVAEA
jgi:hypothetical protein